jgi:hypothetical protein
MATTEKEILPYEGLLGRQDRERLFDEFIA